MKTITEYKKIFISVICYSITMVITLISLAFVIVDITLLRLIIQSAFILFSAFIIYLLIEHEDKLIEEKKQKRKNRNA